MKTPLSPLSGGHFVYGLRSLSFPDKIYIGYSRNLGNRLVDHNQGKSTYTSPFIPWQLEFYLVFSSKDRALEFEAYLKSHSGKAFANKRLWVKLETVS